jgi:hypothetical protein
LAAIVWLVARRLARPAVNATSGAAVSPSLPSTERAG